MIFPSGGSKFDEELQTLKCRFEKWSHCERAIAVCSMLKHFQYPTLRFIQSKIEATYAQSADCEKNLWMEQKSNDKKYIYELCDSYKSLTNTSDVQLNNNNKDSIFFESDRLIIDDNNKTNLINSSTINYNNNNYSNNNANSTSIKVNLVADKFSTKEDVLKEILNCILMLKSNNDSVIQEYLAFIPFMVDDTQHRAVNIEVVMQTLSILVAHPALSSDDLRTVKEHIERLKGIIQMQNVHFANTGWQTIAKPSCAFHHKIPTNILSSLSSVGSSQVQNENFYDTQSDYIETDSGSNGGSRHIFVPNISLSCKQCHGNTNEDPYGFLNESDDQNISFSKNGTEIHDFNPDQEQTSQFHKNLTLKPLIDSIGFKTRRSNSLTTGGIKHNDHFLGAIFTSSTENISHAHKQRSFSLSTENPRFLMTHASGSDSRLDELKPEFQVFQTQHPGMKYIYYWLKYLRLHKYTHIFNNFTYEKMMDITDEYLETINVTQGARTKLVNSIRKLEERFTRLTQAEQDLMKSKITMDEVIKLLLEIVRSPMKPIDIYDVTDIAAQFLKLLNVVCKMMTSKPIRSQDEDSVNQLIEIFNIAQEGNKEPFLSHTNELKSLRYEIDVLKMNFPPKNHYHKNGNGSANGNPNKARWSSSSKLHNKIGGENKPHRKNSNPNANFPFGSMQQLQKQQKPQHLGSKSKPTQQRPSRQSEFSSNYHPTPTGSYSKSSSYPNFSSNSNGASSNGKGQQYASISNQNTNPQLHYSYHRHSVSNLITVTPSKTTETITPTSLVNQHQNTSSCVGLHLSSQSTPHSSSLGSNSTVNSATIPITSSTILAPINYCSHQCSAELTPLIGRSSSTGGSIYPKQATSKHLLGDISPYRELDVLSLQMTEQAIN